MVSGSTVLPCRVPKSVFRYSPLTTHLSSRAYSKPPPTTCPRMILEPADVASFGPPSDCRKSKSAHASPAVMKGRNDPIGTPTRPRTEAIQFTSQPLSTCHPGQTSGAGGKGVRPPPRRGCYLTEPHAPLPTDIERTRIELQANKKQAALEIVACRKGDPCPVITHLLGACCDQAGLVDRPGE